MMNHGLHGSHGCGVENVQSLIAQLAGSRILTSLLTQFISHQPIVSALPRQSSDHHIFCAARGELVPKPIVAAVPRQFTTEEAAR